MRRVECPQIFTATSSVLLHLIRLPHAEATTTVRYQIAMASSPNATASRRPIGSSTASS
jgi:hypothetical protein